MANSLEDRLNSLMHEIKEIKKELILQKIRKSAINPKKVKAWRLLGKRIAARWDNISAVDEIIQQREKTW